MTVDMTAETAVGARAVRAVASLRLGGVEPVASVVGHFGFASRCQFRCLRLSGDGGLSNSRARVLGRKTQARWFRSLDFALFARKKRSDGL